MLTAVAVDMPAVTRADLTWYAEQLLARPGAVGVMGVRGTKTEPLPLMLRATATPIVERRLATGRRSLHGLIDEPGVDRVDASALPPRVWLNVNTPGEWEQFLAHAVASPAGGTARQR